MASAELKSYVRILRKLEGEPAEAPKTTAAIRSLERARRHRAAVLLTESRQKTQELLNAAKAKELAAAPKLAAPLKPLLERLAEPKPENEIADAPESRSSTASSDAAQTNGNSANGNPASSGAKQNQSAANGNQTRPNGDAQKKSQPSAANKDKVQKPISEVLRDIYD